jgi:G3E family GTPase
MSTEARRPPPPFPLTVLTGFLGAGKTTLLNALLKDPALSETLVLINEFGETGLDHLFVEKVDGDMLVMSSGCLCCSLRGDLIATLEDVLRKTDNGRIPPFRRVIIETTGLADPAPVLQTIMYHPYLMLRFRLDGVVTLVDAVNGAATLDAHLEAVKQAAMADRLVLTKTDLLPTDAEAEALIARLKGLNPGALVLDASKGEADAAALLDAGLYNPATKSADVARWLNEAAYPAPHAHEHQHDVNRHDASIRAFCLRHEEPVAIAAFDLFLGLLRDAHGPHLLRLKGIISLADDPLRPVVIHGVQHIFHPPVRLDSWPDQDHATRMVFILKDMEPSFVEALWRGFCGTPSIDTPDASARLENPLTPKLGGLLA